MDIVRTSRCLTDVIRTSSVQFELPKRDNFYLIREDHLPIVKITADE